MRACFSLPESAAIALAAATKYKQRVEPRWLLNTVSRRARVVQLGSSCQGGRVRLGLGHDFSHRGETTCLPVL
jgi:hypothetical protein